MKTRSYLPHVIVVTALVLLFGGLGALGPSWATAATGIIAPDAPSATVADAITYQGYLTDADGMPLSGPFTMRFALYNAPSGGDLLWEGGDSQITVNDGLFAARLEVTTDIFNGEELWVEQTINGELLTPRQEILPAPMAHTLRPGAIVKGTANAIPNNYVLDVQMNNDAFAFNRGAIFGRTTTGNAIQGLAASGRALYGQTEDGFAVYGFDGGSEANRGYAGYFYSTNGIGVYGYSAGDRSHPNIYAPGVYGQSNQGVGVYGRGDTSNSHTFYNEGGYFEGGKGLYARGTDPAGQGGYGARIFSSNYRGMYVQGGSGQFDAYFGGNAGISTNGVIDRTASTRALVVNGGQAAIAPGDLVAMAGVAPSPEHGQPMLAVAKVTAANYNGVIGVAIQAAAVEANRNENTTEPLHAPVDFATTVGAAAPDGYLVIVTAGLAPAVNLSSFSVLESLAIGDKVALSPTGGLARADAAAEQVAIGKVAGPVDVEHGVVPLFIDIE